MLTAVSWTHPVHGQVTEVLCPAHEQPARAALGELDIEYTWRLSSRALATAAARSNAGSTGEHTSQPGADPGFGTVRGRS